ncbi:hexameric tyrosine-coordinated heme protein [Arthrobacter sp. H35-D1]|uniref:hexameric tyrosine-coordinated heme protein n=1 Tax=Arthrobacter sp. H35-D1 TaxID=3046202 RepID=UPI0024B9C35F|nr:hexameric tyrosine-coordinated heme protein [Arthrobacter sp. H35-D1]MDJ0315400.1 hexameric tyrosine-coordinated heme protein [Arthrobacter sp. H35-D1]
MIFIVLFGFVEQPEAHRRVVQGETKVEMILGGALITSTPAEPRQLAMMLARKRVGAIQPDAEVRDALRPNYSHDPDSLTAAAHVVAIEFATVAAASNYWRRET